MKKLALFLVVFQLISCSEIYQQSIVTSTRKCVPVTIPMCSDLAYNTTIYPNLLNHQTQEDANQAISQFNPLVKVKCSEDIKLFLCTIYAPVCTVLEQPIPPCRHLCLSAKNGCESLMIKFGFRWPEQLECDKFPSEGICVGENKTTGSTPSPHLSGYSSGLECPATMRASLRSHTSSLQLQSGILEECSLPCAPDNQVPMLFDSRMRRYIRFWTGGWAVACCVCCLFTITTFLIDLGRFVYPVRPILYMALCYLAISIVYMIGVVGEERFSCGSVASAGQPLVTQGVESVPCSSLAVIHYFFTMASSAWWVVLCLAWFLEANLEWGHEPIESLWVHFHFTAWGIPAVMSVAVLVNNAFDGDVFTGICSVGNLRSSAMFYFMVVPLVGCLVIGFLLLACGIGSMLRIRRYIKLQQPDVDRNISKLEKLMLRICAFAVMFAMPTAASAAILCYQAFQMPAWLEGWYARHCLLGDRTAFGFTIPRLECPERTNVRQPELILFLIKYFTQLVVGISCAVWICSSKTFSSYKKFYARKIMRRTAVATNEQ